MQKLPPILEHPGDAPGLIDPRALSAHQARVPRRAVLCFFQEAIEALERRGELRELRKLPGEGPPVVLYRQGEGDSAVTVAWPGLGAPFAAATLEELIGLGGQVFVCVGGAGVLDGAIPVGQVLIPTAALRDEGTSYHYQRRGRFSRPSKVVLAALREACRAAGRRPLSVKTWTTDGVYRETPAMIRRRRAEGCRAVEMEAAAFFAVARFRRVLLGQLLYAGDDVSGQEWRHRRWNQQTATRAALLQLALDAVRRVPESALSPEDPER